MVSRTPSPQLNILIESEDDVTDESRKLIKLKFVSHIA